QPGTYNEAASSSWQLPGGVWTPSTVPTSVTITITRTFGPQVETTIPIGGSVASVLPTSADPVEFELPSDAPLDVVIPEGAGEVTVKLGTPTAGVVITPVDLTVSAADGASLVIPAGTTVSAPDDPTWDGVISLPTIVEDVAVPTPAGTEKATVGYAIRLRAYAPCLRRSGDAPCSGPVGEQVRLRRGRLHLHLDRRRVPVGDAVALERGVPDRCRRRPRDLGDALHDLLRPQRDRRGAGP